MDDTPSDASHLQQDTGGLIAELDVKEYLETRERNAREDRAFAYKTRILDRAKQVTQKTYHNEIKQIKNSLHDLSAKTPNLRSLPHFINSGRPRSYQSLKVAYGMTNQSSDPKSRGKDETTKTPKYAKSLPALDRRTVLSPLCHSDVGVSDKETREGIPTITAEVRSKTVDPAVEMHAWAKPGSLRSDSTSRGNLAAKKQAFNDTPTTSIQSDRSNHCKRGRNKVLPPLKAKEDYWKASTKNLMRRNKFVANSLSNLYRKRKRLPSLSEEQIQPNFIIQREYLGQPTSTIHSSFDANQMDTKDWKVGSEILKI